MTAPAQRWDLFCKVVDNFGDIGVCWRLALALVDAHGLEIRLWVDDWALAQRFAGTGHPAISIQHWTDTVDFFELSGVVIETFACGLPAACQQRMREQHSVWVNLDYLSAEAWVESIHGLPSPQANGLVRHFFYPGFTNKTGGLLREQNLAAVQASADWCMLGLSPADDVLNVSLFCYPHAPVSALVESLIQSVQPVRVLVTAPVVDAVAQALQINTFSTHTPVSCGNATFVRLPFLSQANYDCLLSLCDANFVRGEDSWIRAIWAAKPFIWLPYRQTEDTHLEKLDAFLQHYLQDAEANMADALRVAMLAWAKGDWQVQHWQALLAQRPLLEQHARSYAKSQAAQQDLATNLVIFIEKLQNNRV